MPTFTCPSERVMKAVAADPKLADFIARPRINRTEETFAAGQSVKFAWPLDHLPAMNVVRAVQTSVGIMYELDTAHPATKSNIVGASVIRAVA